MARTYGLGGAGLAGVGMQQQGQALDMLGRAAEQEQSRNLQNQQLEQQRKAGNVQLGSSIGSVGGAVAGSLLTAQGGALAGSVAGPVGVAVGAMVGGLLGSIGGSLF